MKKLNDSFGVGRRDFLAAAGLSVVASSAVASVAHAASSRLPHTPVSGRAEDTDLYVLAEPVTVGADNIGTLRVTVGNYGGATANPVKLRVVSPFYVNFGTLPSGVTYLLENSDPDVQEIVEYTITAPISPTSPATLELPVKLLDGGPNKPAFGRVTVAADPADNDAVRDHNQQAFSVSRPASTYTTNLDGNVNVYHIDETVPLAPGKTRTVNFKIANAAARLTSKPLKVTLSTPFYVNFGNLSLLELAFGAKKLYTNPDPAVPEVAQFTIPAGLSNNVPVLLSVPLTLVAGGPVGLRLGDAITVAQAPDIDADPSSSHHPFGVIALG